MPSPNIQAATEQARNLALLQIAKRSQTDLYYLCKHILGYDLMTERTHGELCTLTETLLPSSYKALQGPSNTKDDLDIIFNDRTP